MEITDELIRKFLNDECNRQEAEQVVDYLSRNPGILEKYAGEAEWRQFKNNDKIPPTLDTAIWQQIQRQTTERKNRLFYIKPWAVAAAITALLVTAGTILLKNHTTPKSNIAALPAKTAVPPAPALARIENTGSSVKTIALKDGSVVSLQPNSLLQYEEPFRPDARLLYLKGEALFKVAKDKARPFTVEAGGFATTALGTSFRITVFQQQSRVRVQLITGKVVVKATGDSARKPFKDVYLLPSQELNIDTKAMLTMVSRIQDDRALAKHSGRTANPGIDKTNEETGLGFRNQPLTRIFTALQSRYHVQLEYDHIAMDKIFFTGKFNNDEKIDSILQLLAVLNKLAVTKEGEVYTIKK